MAMQLRTGKIDVNVYDRSVRKRLGTALVPNAGRRDAESAMRRTSVDSVTMDTAQCGYLAVTEAVNDLSADGYAAESIETSILLPAGAQEESLRRIEDQIREAALSQGVKVTGGHTEVTDAVTRPVITVAAAGRLLSACEDGSGAYADGMQRDIRKESSTLSDIHRERSESADSVEAGAAIVMTGFAGMEGTYMLAADFGEQLRERFPLRMISDMQTLLPLLSVRRDAEAVFRAHANPVCVVNASEGGIYAALWELSERTHMGFEVSLPDIPIFQETIEFTDHFGINPYEMQSAGTLLIAADHPETLTDLLEQQNIHAQIIGHLCPGRDKIITNGDERQSMNRPAADSLIPLYAGKG
ncbi:MAG: AIR synthase-related protein [Lachnospiraceae bacterium]|nr:AIR synthase-related protein [Lachnospiraceae bacterium]